VGLPLFKISVKILAPDTINATDLAGWKLSLFDQAPYRLVLNTQVLSRLFDTEKRLHADPRS